MTETVAIDPQRAQELIGHLPVTVYRTTPDGRILEGNRAVEDLLGYTVEEFKALHANELYFDPADRGPFMQERIEEGDIVRTVLRMKRKDGAPIWAEDVGRAVKDADGNVRYFDGTLVDITDQVEAERALRESEQLLRTIHDKAPIAIFTLGPDGKVQQANPQAHRMLGLGDGALLGKTISEFTFADDAKESQEAFMRLKEGHADEVSLDKRYRRVDGKAIWGHVRAVAIRTPDGAFSHTISLVQDISRRKRTEDAFRLLDRLTHEVNEATDLDDALGAVLETVCDSIGFTYGEAWMLGDDGRLILCPAWHGPESIDMMKFRRISEKVDFGPGEGVPGKTMDADGTLWFEDLSHGQTFVRAAAAAAAGLTSALSVPVRSGQQLIAVLVFLDGPRETPQDDTLRLVKFLADRLGSTMARRRLEVRLAEQARIMETQFDGASEGILVTSDDGRILRVNRRFIAMCGIDVGSEERAMTVFGSARHDPAFMDRVRQAYEDRTDGQGCVELDDVLYERRSVPLRGNGGRVWYFRPLAEGNDVDGEE